MFSLQIVDTDAFLEMPVSSQLLYFHLSMRADDDGFVANPKKIMRTIGVGEDDLKVLLAKRFVLGFDSGVLVIKHWRMNNYIQNDRYKETAYLEEKSQLQIKDNGSYTECIQIGNTGKVSIGKDRLEIEKDILSCEPNGSQINELMNLFHTFNPATNYGNKTQREALNWVLKEFGLEQASAMVKYALSIQGQKFAPVITTPLQFKNKFGDLKTFAERQKNNNLTIIE